MKCWNCGKEMWENENGWKVCPDLECQNRTQAMFSELARLQRLRQLGFGPSKEVLA